MTTGGFQRGGTYVVAGGHGGLGRGLSAELARRYGARVVWLGRRAEDAEIATGLAELRAAGGEGAYFQADLTREDAVAAAFAAVRARWGRVDGVVHSALVLRDRSFDRMREEDLLAALGPKVEGFAVLAREAHRAGAGWLLVFSSVVSLYHGPGQANYNAGSTFTDEYARWAEATYGLPVRVINWGFWGEVGVVATPRHRREMAARGLGSIGVAEGFAVVERVLAGAVPQVAYLKASPALLEDLRVLPAARAAASAPSAATGLAALDAYARALLAARLRAQGLEARLTAADLAPAGEVARRLADALLPAAREALAAARVDPDALRQALLENHPDHAGHADLLAPCVAALPDVLAGRVRGTDVLFPGGSLALVRRV
jgi:NAD(P)-dependent dehydrogenase (short-subunit alcohol dehydrogenase family)